jgi:hypothetical protein
VLQVVASMVPGSSAGHSILSRRFTARMRLAVMGYPEPQQLEAVYTRMIQQVRTFFHMLRTIYVSCATAGGSLHTHDPAGKEAMQVRPSSSVNLLY